MIGRALRAGGVLGASRPVARAHELAAPVGAPGCHTRLGELGAGMQISRLVAERLAA